MIAVRIGPDMRMAVVAAPSYFEKHSRPRQPQDLTNHACINLRLPTYGNVYAWEFAKNGREMKVHVDVQLTFNNIALRVEAALAGLGLAYAPRPRRRSGRQAAVAGSASRPGASPSEIPPRAERPANLLTQG
jgi:DNA-binding transcriptional LysR family regulator